MGIKYRTRDAQVWALLDADPEMAFKWVLAGLAERLR